MRYETRPTMKAWIIVAVALSVVAGAAIFNAWAPLGEAGSWGLATPTWGLIAMALTVGGWVTAKRDPKGLKLPAAAAVLAVATIASGALGAANVKAQADESAEAVHQMRAHDPSTDAEDLAIDSDYIRGSAAPIARLHALVGLAGLLPLAASLVLLVRVMRARGGSGAQERGASRVWLVLVAVGGVGATAAGVVAAAQPVVAVQDPEAARQTLMERRFWEGDLSGACRVLESRLQSVGEGSTPLPDARAKAERCVAFEVERARKLGKDRCETTLGMLQPMRFVRVAGREELVSSCSDPTD